MQTSFQPEKAQEKRQQDYQVKNLALPVLGPPEVPDEADGKESHHQVV
jgi:hypothetical protein